MSFFRRNPFRDNGWKPDSSNFRPPRTRNTRTRRPTGRVVAEVPDWPDLPDPPRPRATGSAIPEHQVSAPSTILEQVIPVVYGESKVPGLCAGWDVSGTSLRMVFVFCYGPQNSLTDIEINGEAISGLAWVTLDNTFLGGGSESRPAAYMTWYDETDWDYMIANFAVLTVNVALRNANTPGGFQVTAVPTGRKFASFVSPYTVSNHTNLAEVAYDIYTADLWKGLTSPADTGAGGTWERFEDWCDEVMGDSSKRYSFNGKISNRDPDGAIDAVLGAGFASKYFSSDGVVKIWSEAPPEAITGTWTAAASATLTGSGGDASNELEADDIVYAGSTPCIVVSTTGTDTIVVDRVVTITAEKVRLTSGVYLKKTDWASMPVGEEAETGAIPDLVRVRYTLPDIWGSAMYPETIGGSDDKRLEVSVPACSNASMARRISETYLSLIEDQPFSWTGTAGPAAAALEPGDVFFFDTDVLTFQAAKVVPPVSHSRGGVTQLGFRQYDPDTSSDNTQADPTVPTPPTGYLSGSAPHFSAINTVTSGGVAYNFLRWTGTEIGAGDSSVITVFDGVTIRLENDVAFLGLKYTSGTIQMLKVTSGDLLQLGEGSIPIYLNSRQILLAAGGVIRFDQTTPKTALGWSAGSAYVYLGNSSNRTDILGSAVYLNPVASGNVYVNGATTHLGATTQIEMTNNNIPVYGRRDGGGLIQMLRVNANDILIFGDTSYQTHFNGVKVASGPPSTTYFGTGDFGMYKNSSDSKVYWCYNDGGALKTTELS